MDRDDCPIALVDSEPDQFFGLGWIPALYRTILQLLVKARLSMLGAYNGIDRGLGNGQDKTEAPGCQTAGRIDWTSWKRG